VVWVAWAAWECKTSFCNPLSLVQQGVMKKACIKQAFFSR